MMKALSRSILIAVMLGAVLLGGLWTGVAPSQAQTSSWLVQVFAGTNFESKVWEGASTAPVNYTWTNEPIIDGVTVTAAGADNYSVRFTAPIFFNAGTYRFRLTVNDGGRLTLDYGNVVINQWASVGSVEYTADVTFPTDGTHNITAEMNDTTLDYGIIILSWTLLAAPTAVPATSTPVPTAGPVYVPSTNAWYADFYNNPDLSGGAVYSGSYPPSGLNLDWGLASPNGAVPVDNFSARFTRTINVPADMPAGTYKFYARADDAFRFYVNNNAGSDYLLFDYWGYKRGETFTADFPLVSGSYTLRFEYQELSAEASVFLTWSPPNAQNPILNPDSSTTVPGATAVSTVISATATPVTPPATGTVNVNILNFRAAPSLSAEILQKLNRGFTYPIRGRTPDSTWLYLNVGSQPGWVVAQYITVEGDLNAVPTIPYESAGIVPTPTPTPIPAIALPQIDVRGLTLANLNIRSDPQRRAEILGVIPWNAEVQVYGKDAGHAWYLVVYNGITGWSSAWYIRLTQGAFDDLPYLDGSVPVYAPTPTEGIIAQAFGNMRIRTGPGLTYPQISKAQWGTRVEVLGRSPDRRWLKIRHGDVVGWSSAPWYRIVQGSLSDVPFVTE